MIDKSIRQHYETGDEVKKLGYDVGRKLISPLKDKYIAQDTGKIKKGEIAKDIGINFAKKAVAKKLGLASINPLLSILSLFGIDPISWLTKKMTEGGVEQAFTAGMTGTQADRESAKELRVLEKRRANMLQRKEEGKKISEKNLEDVTAQIKKIKKTAPIIDYETEAYGAPDTIKDILDKQYEFEDKKTEQLRSQIIPETPEIIIPHLEEDRIIPIKPVYIPPDVSDRHPDIPAPRVTYVSPARPHGNGGGNGSGGKGSSPSDAPGTPFLKGGRIDKALGGRSRDI